MTPEKIETLLATHRAQFERANRMLKERHYELEENGDLQDWVDIWSMNKQAIEWLEEQKAKNE